MKRLSLLFAIILIAVHGHTAQTPVALDMSTKDSIGALKGATNTALGTVEANRQDHETRVAAMETGKAAKPYINASAPADTSLDWYDTDQEAGVYVHKKHNGTTWVRVGSHGVQYLSNCASIAAGMCVDTDDGKLYYHNGTAVVEVGTGGSGTTYTAGTGIDITSGVISSTVTGTLPPGTEGQGLQKGASVWEAVDYAPLSFGGKVVRDTVTGLVSIVTDASPTNGSTKFLTSDAIYDALAGKEAADSTIVKVAEIDTQAEFESLVGWTLPSGSTGGYVSLSAAPYSDVACTTGQYGYYGTTAYLCTGGFWASKWTLTTHTNASPSDTALVRWDGGDTAGSQTTLNVFSEASGALTTTGTDFSVLGVGGSGHSAEVLNGDTVNFSCTDGTSIDLDHGQIDMYFSRSATPESYGTFFMLGAGANDFRLQWYTAPGETMQFRYGGNRYSWPVPNDVCPWEIGTFYKITLIWDRVGADPILKINDVVVTGGSWTTGSAYPAKPTIGSPIMYVLTDNAGDYQPFGRVDNLAIYPVAQ